MTLESTHPPPTLPLQARSQLVSMRPVSPGNEGVTVLEEPVPELVKLVFMRGQHRYVNCNADPYPLAISALNFTYAKCRALVAALSVSILLGAALLRLLGLGTLADERLVDVRDHTACTTSKGDAESSQDRRGGQCEQEGFKRLSACGTLRSDPRIYTNALKNSRGRGACKQ